MNNFYPDKFPVGTRFKLYDCQTDVTEIRPPENIRYRFQCMESEYRVVRRELGGVVCERFKKDGSIDESLYEFGIWNLLAVCMKVYE